MRDVSGLSGSGLLCSFLLFSAGGSKSRPVLTLGIHTDRALQELVGQRWQLQSSRDSLEACHFLDERYGLTPVAVHPS